MEATNERPYFSPPVAICKFCGRPVHVLLYINRHGGTRGRGRWYRNSTNYGSLACPDCVERLCAPRRGLGCGSHTRAGQVVVERMTAQPTEEEIVPPEVRAEAKRICDAAFARIDEALTRIFSVPSIPLRPRLVNLLNMPEGDLEDLNGWGETGEVTPRREEWTPHARHTVCSFCGRHLDLCSCEKEREHPLHYDDQDGEA